MSERRRGRLRATELAEAVVLADLALALTIVGQVVPLGTVFLLFAVVPFAVVAARHRLRAVIAGAIAASAVGFLVVGTAAFTSVGFCAAFGAVVGAADRRNWSATRTMVAGVVLLWPPIAALAVLVLTVFSNFRELVLENVQNSWEGLFHLLENVGLDGAARAGSDAVEWVVTYWYLSIPLFLLVAVVFALWLTRGLARPALGRVRRAFGDAQPEVPADDPLAASAPAPVPVTLRNVSFRYPNAATDALHDVSLRIEPGEFVVVVGRNGSGKSTLARIVAGRRAATAGIVERTGAVGLGTDGGTALVFQRPEAQVLGVRVRDDIVWGVADPSAVDVEAALDRVGLLALADRETSTLSGGELQRLAIASALVRRPQLLVSDESTAMVDADGRVALVELLRALADDGTTVVHVSHHPAEAAAADRTIALDQGQVVDAAPTRTNGEHPPHAHARGKPIIELRGVGHVYSRGTPWANRALTDVNLTIRARESVLVVGHNGSGKSTLAWILAGLTVPSEGEALLDGKPISEQVRSVGLSFQHARLQLLRPIVVDEVKVAAGVNRREAVEALAAVGLDAAFGERRIDELSGGQMRRVVLAQVLAAKPRAIVLDEPFAGLDAEGRADLEQLLITVRDEHGIALIIVSHDHDLPPALVERVVELDGGRIVRDHDVVEEATP